MKQKILYMSYNGMKLTMPTEAIALGSGDEEDDEVIA